MASFPPPEAKARAVLVTNISHLATPDAVADFFSFCGPIEAQKLRVVRPAAAGADATFEAVVIFADEASRRTAIMMNDSSIVDQPVAIKAVPEGYVFAPDDDLGPAGHAAASAPVPAAGGWGFGGFFADVGTVVAAEYQKASQMIDSATDTGVLKTAKDQVAMAGRKTKEMAVDFDDKYHVRNTLLNAADVGKAQANAVASAVAEQTKTVAERVDGTLHISEKTGMIAEKALENQTVQSGYLAFTGGLHSLMAQTGLQSQGETTARTAAPQDSPSSPTAF